jgi:hypothetical protein
VLRIEHRSRPSSPPAQELGSRAEHDRNTEPDYQRLPKGIANRASPDEASRAVYAAYANAAAESASRKRRNASLEVPQASVVMVRPAAMKRPTMMIVEPRVSICRLAHRYRS